ncbi:Type 1 glutamine amidotransferase-like domain-containing protein, partial [Candidatus Saccharibacteria bacterium]|nr:Type 1 glutamine amidotransferase-like domain-containing protein [Candidatus Saccharibacteria bacterium]
MSLVLTSHVTPIIKALLENLNPRNSKVMVVMNARDYHDADNFAIVTREKVTEFIDAGFKSVESLDLKEFFQKPDQLTKTLNSYNPDVICAVGGDEFLLNTAIKLSGFDTYLKSRLKDSNFFYCGSSAGAIVVVRDLKYYLLSDESTKLVRDHYG